MTHHSRTTPILVVGIGITLVMGVSFAWGRSRARESVAAPSSTRVNQEIREPQVEQTAQDADWWQRYQALVTPPVEKEGRGVLWRVQSSPSTCTVERFSQKNWTAVGQTASRAGCFLVGASIEGRYAHVALPEIAACTSPDCEGNGFSVWRAFDERTQILRPISRPFPEGAWQAIDPVRTIGLYRGVIRSTLSEGFAARWALVDDGGALLWQGAVTDIVTDAQEVVALRLASRPDKTLVLAYRAKTQDGLWVSGLAKISPLQKGALWTPVALSEDWKVRAWRLERFEQVRGVWSAVLRFQQEDGSFREEAVPVG